MNTTRQDDLKNVIKSLSQRDFLNFGLHQVAYIRPVELQDRTAYAVHAADGTPLTVMDTMDTAMIVVRHNELEPVTVH